MGKLFMAGIAFSLVLSAAPGEEKKKEAASGKVKDVVCGMMVDKKDAEKAEYKGKTYYFCSREEKADFEKNPQKYVAKK